MYPALSFLSGTSVKGKKWGTGYEKPCFLWIMWEKVRSGSGKMLPLRISTKQPATCLNTTGIHCFE